jgi:hypothetical protein
MTLLERACPTRLSNVTYLGLFKTRINISPGTDPVTGFDDRPDAFATEEGEDSILQSFKDKL